MLKLKQRKYGLNNATGFKNYLNNLQDSGVGGNQGPLGGIDLNVYVLTTGFWPTQTPTKCNLPNEILNCCEVFKKFYLSNHNGRRLTWQTNMGTAEIKAQFSGKKHELIVSTYQMVILLLFNDSAKISFKYAKTNGGRVNNCLQFIRDITDATGIPAPELKRNLTALTSVKNKILEKEPATPKIEETDSFLFNSKFKSKLVRVKVMALAQKETPVEEKETRQKVDEDRKHQYPFFFDLYVVVCFKFSLMLSHD